MSGKKQCAVRSCKTFSGKGIIMHRFPKNPELYKKWINFCNSSFLLNYPSLHDSIYGVCGLHFDKTMYRNARQLYEFAVPSIHAVNSSNSSTSANLELLSTVSEIIQNNEIPFTPTESITSEDSKSTRITSTKGLAPIKRILKNKAAPRRFFSKKQPLASTAAREARVNASSCLDFIDDKRQEFENNIYCTIEQIVEDVPMLCAQDEVIGENKPDKVGAVLSKVTSTVGTQTTSFHFFTIQNFIKNDEAICFYTGLETYDKFEFVLQTLCPEAYFTRNHKNQSLNLSFEDQFFLTLIKLKRNKENFELGLLFNIDRTSVDYIFCTWINLMHQSWSMLDAWPKRELVKYYMPDESTMLIVDCTQGPVEKYNNPATQQASISNNMMGDGSGNAQDLFASKAVNNPFLKVKSQLPVITALQDHKLSSKRIHMERIHALTKSYKILQSPLKELYHSIARKIYGCCYMICTFG